MSSISGVALRTDHYELTMLESALSSGLAGRRSVFEVFARSLPEGRRYGVVAGTARLLEALGDFEFERRQLDWLVSSGVVHDSTAEWLSHMRFAGDVDGYEEGEVYFPGSPVLTVEASFGEALLLETIVLSILNFDSGVATSAARTVRAAGGRALVEMGSRRTHEDAAVAAARAAYIAGFGATSNLLAGMLYGIPTAGTSAHAFTLAYEDEASAFRAQVAALGPATTLLVDTFDVETGIANAVAAAGEGLGAIRIDSGDLAAEASKARCQLDSIGATGARIVLSGDLDAQRIARMVDEGVPADAFGVGTHIVSGEPPGFVYKLVAIASSDDDGRMRQVAKKGGSKATVGGRKSAWRRYSHEASGPRTATQELVLVGDESGTSDDRPLQVPLVRSGEPARATTLEDARSRCAASLAELPGDAFDLTPGPPCIETVRSLHGRARSTRG